MTNSEQSKTPIASKRIGARMALHALCLLFRIIPLWLHVPIANALSNLLYRVLPRQRDLTHKHLEMAFGNRKTPAELDALTLAVNRNMLKNTLEFTRFPFLNQKQILRLSSFDGEQNLISALEKKKGIITVSAHFGNWELLGAALVARGYPLTVVRRDQNDSIMNDFILEQRTRTGIKTVPRDKPLFKHLLGLLKNNELVALISDQNAGADGIFVNYFGRPAATFRGPGLFGIISGAPIVPIFIVREGYMKHRVVIRPEIIIEPSGDVGQDIATITQAFTKVIEEMVEQYPDQWMWQHRRWKTAPPGI